MPANPRILTLGDTIYSLDAQPGDVLVLNENLIPEWTSLDEIAARIADALSKREVKKP